MYQEDITTSPLSGVTTLFRAETDHRMGVSESMVPLIAAWGHLAAEKTNAWKEQEISAIHPASFWLGGQGWPTPPSHMTALVVSPCTSITEHLALFETFHQGVNPFHYKYFFSFVESLSEKLQYLIKSGKCVPSAALSSSR